MFGEALAQGKAALPPGEAAAAEAAAAASAAAVDAAAAEEQKKSGPTPAQLTAIRAAIANAATLEEIQRLEKALTSGNVPGGDADMADG